MPEYTTGVLVGAIITKGDWVCIAEAYDIPPMLRNYRPTAARVEDPEFAENIVLCCVPIGDDDIDEHSQAVPYPVDALIPKILD